MNQLLKQAFTGKTAIATVAGIIMAIAIGILAYRTRNDPFPKPVPKASP